MDVDHIKEMVNRGWWVPTDHFNERMDERTISILQALTAIRNGSIIKEFPKRKPNPECIIQGYVERGIGGVNFSVPLYVVCGIGEVVFFITVDWNMPREFSQKRKQRRFYV